MTKNFNHERHEENQSAIRLVQIFVCFVVKISLRLTGKDEQTECKRGLAAQGCWAILRGMSTLAEIQAATEKLPLRQQEELYRLLGARLHPAYSQLRKARAVRSGNDTLLEAPPDAPPMTAENVKRILEEWP